MRSRRLLVSLSALEAYGTCTLEQDGCTTCGDIAIPVRVIQVEANNAVVEDRLGQQTEVAIDFIDNVQPDDVLLVHMGIALSKIDTSDHQQLKPVLAGGDQTHEIRR
jgi:hydrogenase expression/formation protein HypC